MNITNSKKYLVPAAIGVILVIALPFYFFFRSVSTLDETHYLYIDADDTQDSVINKIKPIALPTSMAGLQTLLRHAGYEDHIKTGRYAIKPGEGAITIFRHLRSGQQESLHLTIPEVRTMDRLAAVLGKRLMIDSATIASALYSQEVTTKLGYDTCTIAAMFIPNTYEVYWNITPEQLFNRMQKEYNTFWNESRRAKADSLGLTPIEVAIIASIVEGESHNKNEMPLIASLYINRVHKGMLLQACPTVKYAVGDFKLKRILYRHLAVDSPYNTYKYPGLPPGPIRCPAPTTLDMVLNAPKTNYLFMCASPELNNTHIFSSSYNGHAAAARQYRHTMDTIDWSVR
jgi:UPF0755 protein